MRARVLFWLLAGILSLSPLRVMVAQPDWPRSDAFWTIRIVKLEGMEPEDDRWMHLHHGHGTTPDAESFTLGVSIYQTNDHFNQMDPFDSGLDVRYLIRGIPVSGWTPPPPSRSMPNSCRFTSRLNTRLWMREMYYTKKFVFNCLSCFYFRIYGKIGYA